MVITRIYEVFTVMTINNGHCSCIRSLLPNYPDSSALFFSCGFWEMKSIFVAVPAAAFMCPSLSEIVLMRDD